VLCPLAYDLSKSPPVTNTKLKNQKYNLLKAEQGASSLCGLWVKSNLIGKEHFYCRHNAHETAGQYGILRLRLGEDGTFEAKISDKIIKIY
jgi:hypothetical protein